MEPTKESAVLTSERVYLSLREDIATGRLAPGERLRTDRLAELKKVSRMPVREALRQLQHEGLIEATPNCGARVRKVSWQEICEIYEVREALEMVAVRRLTELKPSGEIIGQLREAIAMRRNAQTVADKELADLQLHRLIVQASQKPLISSILESRFILTTSFRLSREIITNRSPEHEAQIDREHDQIVDAVQSGDIQLASAAMQTHFRNAMLTLRRGATQ